MSENALNQRALQLAAQVEKQKGVVRRRELFAAAFTPELMEALEAWMGVKDAIFAFVPGEKDGKLDPLEACRFDTLMGIVRGIRFEIAHKADSESYLAALMKEHEKEVSHA